MFELCNEHCRYAVQSGAAFCCDSLEHRKGVVDCADGYEWWVMQQAVRRNPDIRLYALAWSLPGWARTFWSHKTVRYIVQWLKCARQHDLRINYLMEFSAGP